MEDERVWILDTEGNGAQPGEIIELAAVEMVGLVLTGRHHRWRFRPRLPITYSATWVHGITDADLASCPRVEDHADEIAAILGDHPICGHAVHVELNALQRVLPDWSPRKAYDTLRIARRVLPDLARHRLSHVGDHLGLSDIATRMTSAKAHSAHYDAVLCGLILHAIVHPLPETERDLILRHAEIMADRHQRALRDARKAAKSERGRSHRPAKSTIQGDVE